MYFEFTFWWIFPLICFGLMLIFMFNIISKGGNFCCFPTRETNWVKAQKKINTLEEEVRKLKVKLENKE